MSIYDTLNKEQKEAVMHTEGPLLILAGAGSGKTRVLTHRIVYLIEEIGINPWNIMAITFTNKAAGEMRERVNRLVGFGADEIWVSTFHSTCVRILRRFIDRLGYDNHFTIYDTDDQKTVMKAVMKKLNIDPKQYPERSLLSAISSAKDELLDVRDYELSAMGDFRKITIAKAYREYQETLKRSNALDFDDLITRTVELFRTQKEVLSYYQDRFCYVMVDEYQDTNTAQFELIRLLADRSRNLCAVGDDDQSIYKFRGANIRNILDFESHYPEAKVIKLEQNYRSTQNILDAANAVIRNNRSRKEKALWTGKGAGEKIRFRQLENGFEEADYLVRDIRHKIREDGLSYGDCAVLYRTNAQARLLEERMVVEGIPYHVVGGVNFYSRAEIKDILAYLKTVDNGRDEVALRRIINVPRRGIGAASLEKISVYGVAKGLTLYDAMREADAVPGLGKTAAKIREFVNLVEVLRAGLSSFGIADLIRAILERVQYEQYLTDQDDESVEDRMANVEELITKAVNYEESHDIISLSEFLEEVALVSDLDNVEDGDNRVLLMTLHSAKGLEFPVVYLAGMEDGLFPGYMTINSENREDLEEERRLAYVGITRAKQELLITCAKCRMIRGETQYNPVSRFVREIPLSLLDQEEPVRVRQANLSDLGIPFGGGRGRADGRPRARAITNATPEDAKPFIARETDRLKMLSSLQKGSSLVSGQAPEYGAGDRVRHVKFGEGTVKAVSKEPRDYMVTVEFDGCGQKVMFASFAKLKLIEG